MYYYLNYFLLLFKNEKIQKYSTRKLQNLYEDTNLI